MPTTKTTTTSRFSSNQVFPFSVPKPGQALTFPPPPNGADRDLEMETLHHSPFEGLYRPRLEAIGREFASREAPLTLHVLGCGDLLPKLLLPALTKVLSQIAFESRKLKLVLSDAPGIRNLTNTVRGAQIRQLLDNAGITYEFVSLAEMPKEQMNSVDVAYIATPPAFHLDHCQRILTQSQACVFNEKPACQPHEIERMRQLDITANGRLFHVDWVLGTFPIQYILGCEHGREILRSFGQPTVINHLVLESAPVDPDRNGPSGGYGLLVRNTDREQQWNGYDLTVGMANDLGVHGLYQAYLLHDAIRCISDNSSSLQGECSTRQLQAQYARARINTNHFESCDDTSGCLTFTSGSTINNVVYGKHLPYTFKGFDAINATGGRLLACYGAPAIENEREKRDAINPYLLYIPGTDDTKNTSGTHITFSQNGDERYVGIVLNLLAAGLGRRELILPKNMQANNAAALASVADLAKLKKEKYDLESYDLLEPGSYPDFLPCASRNFGVPAPTSE